MVDVNIDETLDARGLNCPLPVLKTKKALKPMEAGKVLEVFSTDPGTVKDLEAFAEQTGHELLLSETRNDEYYFLIRKA